MKNIEIKTTQNVVLQYELADLRDRALAFFIDLVCLTIAISILSIFAGMVAVTSETAGIIFFVLLYSIFMFYSLAMEIFNNGRSVGKMAMRIQVIKTTGGRATLSDYLARWVFRLVDIYLTFGGIASIMVASSSKAQRIGDIVANTAVIKTTPKINLQLKDVLAIRTQGSYQPEFLQAKQLREADVLLIKSTLDRSRKYNNLAHAEAIDMVADKVKAMLMLQNVPLDNTRFLQTIVNDYVVLTR